VQEERAPLAMAQQEGIALSFVMLSAAKQLYTPRDRSFASLRMTRWGQVDKRGQERRPFASLRVTSWD